MNGAFQGGIFVNYRVRDERFGAAALYELLAAAFGADRVFRDCVSMDPGTYYPAEISGALEAADVLVAVVGPGWLEPDATGDRPIDRPRDWVRTEIARAFARGIPVVPVIVGETTGVPTKAQLPEDIGRFAHQQASFLRHTSLGPDVAALAGRLVKTVPALRVAWFSAGVPSLGEDPAPSELLRAEYGIVPFTGRDGEFAALTAWCAQPAQASAAVVTGPGGAGKTRLVHRLVDAVRAQGWVTGILRETPAAPIAPALGFGAPALLVVDYAETNPALVRAAAAAMYPAAAHGGAPRRLLLVARAAGEWFAEAREDADDRIAALLDRARIFPLAPIVRGAKEYRAEHARAALAFADALRVADFDAEARSADAAELVADALTVHSAALADVLDAAGGSGGAPAPGGHDAIERVLHHERRYWARTAEALRLRDPHRDRLNTVAAAATLFATGSAARADAVLGDVRTLRGQSADVRDRYLRWWQESHPGDLALNPLVPDRLAERHVAECAAACTDAVAAADDDQLVRALDVLARAAARDTRARGRQVVTTFLSSAPARLLPLAVRVAVRCEAPQQLVAVLEELTASADDPDVLTRVIAALPARTEVLKAYCVTALRRGLDLHEAASEPDPGVRAFLHAQLCIRLGDIGEHADALVHAGQAEQGYRALARLAPDPFAFHLAIVLANTSVLERRLGRVEDALRSVDEALDGFARIAPKRPAARAYAAIALAMKATHLSAAGELDAARSTGADAIAALRAAAPALAPAARVNLALLLHNQAVHLVRTGEDEAAAAQAREAREILAGLAAGELDAYLRPLTQMAGGVGAAHDPLEHVLTAAGLHGRNATSAQILALVDASRPDVRDQFIDAVVRVCAPVWQDPHAGPPDELALRTGAWRLDLAEAGNRDGLLAALLAAALSEAGALDAEVPWAAAVLPHLVRVHGADLAPDGVLVLRAALARWPHQRDADALRAALPAETAATVHPLDLLDFADALAALADTQGAFVVELANGAVGLLEP
jgi:tetratricopeptide (TPR) repeat protein